MTPRPLVHGGLRGPGQDIFPDMAKEEAVDIALTEEITILRNDGVIDGGVREEDWEPLAEGVRARIDIVGVRLPNKMKADQINEATTHIFHVDKETDIKSSDRIERDSEVWTVVAVGSRTDQPTIYVEAKHL